MKNCMLQNSQKIIGFNIIYLYKYINLIIYFYIQLYIKRSQAILLLNVELRFFKCY